MSLNNEELNRRLWAYRKQNWNRVQTPAWQERVVANQMAFDATPKLEQALTRFSLDRTKIRYLDVGSGIGDYVLVARKMGIESYGVEPDRIGVGSEETSLKIARDRSTGPHGFASAVGEALPFADAGFDLITMNQVLEHVQDLRTVLNEALRVLKPGGVLLFNSPNYLSFYEPHYKVFWLPLFPRFLANIYLRLRGRDPEFLNGIHYLTRGELNATLQTLPCHFEDETRAYVTRRMATPDQIRNPALRMLASLARAIGADRLAIWIYLNFLTRGLGYVVIKNGDRQN